MSDKPGFTERERKIARALMQLKAEPSCIDCGGSCLVIFEELKIDGPSNIWTACTICGNEMIWTATPNHAEMVKRMVALTNQQKGQVIEPFEFVHNVNGTCKGLCGEICPDCWGKNDVEENFDIEPDDISDSKSD